MATLLANCISDQEWMTQCHRGAPLTAKLWGGCQLWIELETANYRGGVIKCIKMQLNDYELDQLEIALKRRRVLKDRAEAKRIRELNTRLVVEAFNEPENA